MKRKEGENSSSTTTDVTAPSSFAARTKCVVAIGKNAGSVVSQSSAPRSYLIVKEDGVIWRNRAHLRPIHQSEQVPSSNTESESNGQPMPVAEQTEGHSYVTRSERVSHPPKRMDL
ncbi:hypothetical protein DPX16_3676 [Anabarilius grahami]|uniref:Uncharacterized protein n=1 Tax=Anabarilius grahami TaxID=495550 RepID=A0A3N0YQZ6_ANAGA|nr:hypothetical protein DPX16_3676 [Anabarilius grahami]